MARKKATYQGVEQLEIIVYKLHSAWARVALIKSTLFLHDLKGKDAFISAMVSGHRYFHFTRQNNENENNPPGNTTENTGGKTIRLYLRR